MLDLRVFVFTTSYPRYEGDDAGVFVQRLVAALAKLGVHETVFVPRDREESPSEQRDNLDVKRFKYTFLGRGELAFGAGIMPNLRRKPWLCIQAPGLLLSFFIVALRRERCHVIHANWLITALPAALYSLSTGVPFVVTARGEDIKLLRAHWIRKLLSIPLARAASVVAVSQSVATELTSLLPKVSNRLSVIPNGIEVEVVPEDEVLRFRSERNIPKGVPYLLFLGSIVPRKRVDHLIEILRGLPNKQAVLLLCGRLDAEGYVQSLREMVSAYGLQDRVRFEGAVPTQHIPALLALASVYVTASEHEGRPNSVLEAMTTGLPVVASRIPAHAEIINHEQNGYLFSSVADGVAAIESIFKAPESACSVADSAKKSVEHLSWRRSAQAYRDLFLSLRKESVTSTKSAGVNQGQKASTQRLN